MTRQSVVLSRDQITGRLAEIRIRQEAELEFLSRTQEESDYEDLARMQIAHEASQPKALQPEASEVFELSPYAETVEGTIR